MEELGLLTTVLPEFIMAIVGMAFLMLGVFYKGDATKLVSILAIILFAVLAIMIGQMPGETVFAMNGQFVADGFANFMKILVLAGSGLALLLSLSFLPKEDMSKFEYPVLVTFDTLGMLVMVSAND